MDLSMILIQEAMTKDGFVIYKSFYAPLQSLSDESLGKLFRAIFEYQINGVCIDLPVDLTMAFNFFKTKFELDNKKYEAIVERNKTNGKKGGRPSKEDADSENQETQDNPENPVGFEKPKKADKDRTGKDGNGEDKESFKKDIDKSLSQKDTEQGCGDKVPPSDASLPFPPASDASSPDVVGSSENTACGVNVNSFKAPLPPTPRMSSDVYVNEFVERMYAMYPAKCPQRNKSTGKSDKDRSRIKKLLKKYTMEQIELVFRYEIEQKYNKSYMSNFSTFLNNFPDPTQIGVHADNGSADNNSNEPALPNGMTREMYEMYIRNGYEIDEYGRIYKDGIMLK